jgi:hypothetical protein
MTDKFVNTKYEYKLPFHAQARHMGGQHAKKISVNQNIQVVFYCQQWCIIK